MKPNQRFSRWLALRILLIAGLTAWPRVSGWAAAPPGNQGTPSLDTVLNADGTLKQGVDGSFDPRGFKMKYTKDGAPCFAAEAQNASSATGVCSDNWGDRFINSGLDDSCAVTAAPRASASWKLITSNSPQCDAVRLELLGRMPALTRSLGLERNYFPARCPF